MIRKSKSGQNLTNGTRFVAQVTDGLPQGVSATWETR